MDTPLVASQVKVFPKRRATEALARAHLAVDRVNMFCFVDLLLEGGAAFVAFERPQVLVRRSHVAQKAVVEAKRRRALLALEVTNAVVLRFDVLGQVALLAET
jgi:hypothetical protein